MATLQLCDLCGGKCKYTMSSINLRGHIPQYKGTFPPPPPNGFKYHEEALKNNFGKVTYEKVWDTVGNVLRETKYIVPPKKWKEIEIHYDLCENCFDKFCLMLNSIKSKHHLEATQINLIEDKSYYSGGNPFFGLLGNDRDDDD